MDQTASARTQDALPAASATPAPAPAPRPATDAGAAKVTEQTAFALWRMREGDASGLQGAALSAMWAAARPGYLREATTLLATMTARGLRISATGTP
ncbi:hypothetical protein [Loktanella sp. M215]|uniref:hypothetical protein n=1 Tax=Loktanella sp. M215 TaxID=2675431 RepID=UPI001F15EB9E|nr:hypothetical protein [Loktanella sp. M215]MCF7702150.1 hypothetical protein [Loktanella sp. M215]